MSMYKKVTQATLILLVGVDELTLLIQDEEAQRIRRSAYSE